MRCAICNVSIGNAEAEKWGPEFAHSTCIISFNEGKSDNADEIERLTKERDEARRTVRMAHEEGTKQLADCQKDAERYRWLANAVLYCDYGDNHTNGQISGWGIKASKRDGKPFMYGDSINTAIDAAIAAMKEQRT